MFQINLRFYFLLFIRLASDILFINLSFLTAYFIKFRTLHFVFFPINVYLKVLIFTTLIWLIIFNLGGLYKFIRKKEKREDNILAVSFTVTAAAFITLFVIFYLYKEATYAMDLIFYAWLSSLILINFSRSIIWVGYNRIFK